MVSISVGRIQAQLDTSSVFLRRTLHSIKDMLTSSQITLHAESSGTANTHILIPLYQAHANFSWNGLAIYAAIDLGHAPSFFVSQGPQGQGWGSSAVA